MLLQFPLEHTDLEGGSLSLAMLAYLTCSTVLSIVGCLVITLAFAYSQQHLFPLFVTTKSPVSKLEQMSTGSNNSLVEGHSLRTS